LYLDLITFLSTSLMTFENYCFVFSVVTPFHLLCSGSPVKTQHYMVTSELFEPFDILSSERNTVDLMYHPH
jgi:hypothetical protein